MNQNSEEVAAASPHEAQEKPYRGESVELKERLEKICQDAIACLVANESSLPDDGPLQKFRAKIDALRSESDTATEQIHKLRQCKSDYEKQSGILKEKQKELGSLQKEITKFHGPLGAAAFAGLLAGNVSSDPIFTERLALHERVVALRAEYDKLASACKGGIVAKTKTKAQQMIVTGKIKYEELSNSTLEKAIGEQVLASKLDCPETRDILADAAKHQSRIAAAIIEIEKAQSSLDGSTQQELLMEEITGADSFDSAVKNCHHRIEQIESEHRKLLESISDVVIEEEDLPPDSPLETHQAELRKIRSRLDDIELEIDATYMGGHPEYDEKSVGIVCLDKSGISFTPQAKACPTRFKIVYEDVLKISAGKGKFPDAYLKKAEAKKVVAQTASQLTQVAGAFFDIPGESLMKMGAKQAARNAGKVGSPPLNRILLIARLAGSKKKIAFDAIADAKEEMEQHAELACERINESRRMAIRRKEQENSSVRIIGCGQCGAKLRAKTHGTIRCPKCGARIRVPESMFTEGSTEESNRASQESKKSTLKKAATIGAIAAGGAVVGVVASKALGGTNSSDDTDASRASASTESAVGLDINGDGVIDSVAFDSDNDGNADTIATDLDGDGVIDAVGMDTDGDGNIDSVGMDTDGDGSIDAVGMDTDGDGSIDSVGMDTDGDGVIDAVGMDTDGDGNIDSVGMDTDGDGTLDAVAADIDDDGVVDAIGVDVDHDGDIDVIAVDAEDEDLDEGDDADLADAELDEDEDVDDSDFDDDDDEFDDDDDDDDDEFDDDDDV